MSRRVLLLGLALCAPTAARAASFPTRGGESGLLDVPSAEVAPAGGASVAAEFGLDRAPGRPVDVGPLPLSLVTGLGRGFEAGFAVREGGRPGDPRPSPTLFGGALKLRLREGDGLAPALALDVHADRINWNGVAGARAIASTAPVGRVAFASYVGVEGHGPGLSLGPTAGLASDILVARKTDAVLEIAAGPRGPLAAAALRYAIDPRMGVSFGVDWLPRDSGLRFSVGLAINAGSPPVRRKAASPPPAPAKVVSGPKQPVFADDRPHFRLVMPAVAPSTDRGPRHVQYGPWLAHASAPSAARPAAGPSAPLVKRGGLADDEARALERRQAGLEELERRIATATAAARARDEKLSAEAKRLASAESGLLARADEVSKREKSLGPLAHPDDHERQLQVTLQRLRTHEEELQSAEQTSTYAGEAAQQRIAQAAIREERAGEAAKQAEQKLGSVQAGPRGNDGRRALLDARESRLLATQERLAALQDRHDALERAHKARGERLDALEKRIGLASELLAVRTGAPPPGAPVAVAAGAATKGAAPLAPAVAKAASAPTLPAVPPTAAAAPAPPPASWSGEREVVAAGLISLQRPDQPLDELDRQTIGDIARQAAGSSSTAITIVARARTADLLPAAAKRGEEVKAALVAAGPFPSSRIEVRAVVHPREASVGLVVSAFRYLTPPAPTSARPGSSRSTP